VSVHSGWSPGKSNKEVSYVETEVHGESGLLLSEAGGFVRDFLYFKKGRRR
jgi:hypothetical protein